MAILQEKEDIIHRDIKPSNILIIDNEPFLSDFGGAKRFSLINIFESFSVIGTVPYMSP